MLAVWDEVGTFIKLQKEKCSLYYIKASILCVQLIPQIAAKVTRWSAAEPLGIPQTHFILLDSSGEAPTSLQSEERLRIVLDY